MSTTDYYAHRWSGTLAIVAVLATHYSYAYWWVRTEYGAFKYKEEYYIPKVSLTPLVEL